MHLATRQLEVGQLRTGELEGEPQQGNGQGSLGLRGEGGGKTDPGVGTHVGQVVRHLLVGCNIHWAEVQLLLREGEQVQAEMSGD